MSELLAAALGYAELGWQVIACEPRGKAPLLPWVSHGASDATTDPEIVRGWFAHAPDANVGIRCGSESGIIVLDVDPRHGGAAALDRLVAEHGPLPDTIVCETGGGGWHFYFKHPGYEVEMWKADGIELRVGNLYVVAPPSVHPSGTEYRWSVKPGNGTPLADLPEYLRKRKTPRTTLRVPDSSPEEKWAAAALDAELSRLMACPAGNRNNLLNECAFNLGQIVGSGFLPRIVVENRLLDACAANGSLADDGEGKVRGTIRSGLEAGAKEPRYPKDCRPPAQRGRIEVSTANGAATPAEIPEVTYLDLSIEPPPVQWVIRDWLVKHDIGVLAASAGAGKSTLMAALAISLSHGTPWCGAHEPIVTGPVLYFDEEQSRATLQRMFRNLGAEPGHGLHVASCQGMLLSTQQGCDRLRREIDRLNPVLVVLDTVSQVFAGVDLSSLEEVTEVFSRLTLIRNEFETVTMMPTHNRKVAREARGIPDPLEAIYGSVAFGARTDTAWNARRNGNSLEVAQFKRRDNERGFQSMRVAYTKDQDGRITLASEGEIRLADTLQGGAEIAMVEALTNKRIMATSELRDVGVKSGATVTTSRRAIEQLVKIKKIESIKRGFYSLCRGYFEQGDFLS